MNEFMKENLLQFIFRNLKKILIGLVIFIILIVIIISISKAIKKSNQITFYLLGDEEIIVSLNNTYYEPGFVALDEKGNDLRDIVKVTNYLNTNEEGTYNIIYTLNYKKNYMLTRKVNVTKNSKLSLVLLGNEVINIKEGDKYIEPGYTAYSYYDGYITNSVKVSSNLNVNQTGTYQITYTIGDKDGNKESLTRTVIVSPKEKTNIITNVVENKIYLNITGGEYNYTLLPNNTKSPLNQIEYVGSKTGNYIFYVFNKDLSYQRIIVNLIIKGNDTITGNNQNPVTIEPNIKENPLEKLSCQALIDMKSTKVEVINNSNTNYSYKYIAKTSSNEDLTSNQITNKSYTFNGILETSKVNVYENNMYLGDLNCNIQVKQEEPISLSNSNNQILTDSLKIWIKMENNYKYAFIWAKEPYKQLKKYSSIDYGKQYDHIKNIADNAISQVRNQASIIFNNEISPVSSCYYCLKDKEQKVVDKNYANTALVIKNGVVLRNDYESTYRRYIVAGITKTNFLNLYEESMVPYKVMNTEELQTNMIKRKELYNQAINVDKVLNTITTVHENYVLTDGKVTHNEKSTAQRIFLCQSNNNNYMILTSTSKTIQETASKAASLGAKYCIDLDGGGSTNVYFKTKSMNSWSRLTGTGTRGKMFSLLYFTEL